jgi:hypothetical protein
MKRLFCIFVMAGAVLVAPSSGAAATSLLPDLGMAKLSTIKVDTTTMPGHRLLRYTAILVDVGAGPLELIGSRPDASTPDMTAVQRIHDSSGGSSDIPINTTMFYAGDGHNHWHTSDIEGGTLTRVDNGIQVGALAKHGFCFFDNVKYRLTLPGAPQSATYLNSGCDPNQPNALTADMGLSVGWGDSYPASTNLQWIDVTGLPNGKYKLSAVANPTRAVKEATFANNGAWATLRITHQGVTVLKYGPGA